LFSLQIALITTAISAVVGTMASYALVRGNVPWQDTLTAFVLAPLIVPHVIVAIAVYFQFAPLGLVGSRLGFVLIHSALAVPYVVLVVTAALQRVPPSYEMAGLNLGASRLKCFQRITLPLIAPAIAAGAIFAFLASFDETVVSFFISGVEHKTITRKLMEDIEFNLSPLIAAASTIFVVATVLLMWTGTLVKRKVS
jgi:mannopine transport system permease protein